MKKSLFALILAVLLLLSACTSQPPETLTEPAGATVPEGESDPVMQTTENPTEVPSSESASSEEGTGEPSSEKAGPQAMLEAMTLEEKVGQLLFVTPESLSPDGMTICDDGLKAAIAQYGPGGFILFGGNLKNATILKAFTADLKKYSAITPLIGVDEEGGTVARLANNGFDVPKFSSMGDVGDTGDPEEARRTGKAIGGYLNEYGFTLDFAPVADVNSNPANPVIGRRAFSDDPEVAAIMSGAFMDGLHEAGIKSCLKHFPGHGDTAGDTHEGFVLLDKTRAELERTELIPFRENLPYTDTVMVAHIAVPALSGDETPASLSKAVVTDLLREELGFDGVILTDALNMGAIVNAYGPEEAAVLAFEAGVDMLLMPEDPVAAFEAVLKAVKSGRISEERLDQSVRRILTLKGYEI